MKKTLANILAIAILLSITACNKGDSETDNKAANKTTIETTTEETTESTTETTEDNHIVDSIDLSVAEGELKYVGIEKADRSLLEGIGSNSNINLNKVFVLKFQFTNLQQMPADVQSAFWYDVYQNGVELTGSPSYTSPEGNRQADLIDNFFSTVMNGGTLQIGDYVILDDYSPITIYAGSWYSEDYQIMELDISNIK